MDIDTMVNKALTMVRERGEEFDAERAVEYTRLWESSEKSLRLGAAYFAVGFLWGAGEISHAEHNAALEELGGW